MLIEYVIFFYILTDFRMIETLIFIFLQTLSIINIQILCSLNFVESSNISSL